MNPLQTRILLGGSDFWPSETRSKTTTTTATGDLKQRWRLGKVGRPPCFSRATLARNLKQRWRLGAVNHPPLSHATATATATVAAAAQGGSKRRGKATMAPRLCPPPSRLRDDDGGCGARGDDGASELLVLPLPAQQHQQWRLEMERAVRSRRGWGATAGFMVAPMTGCSMVGAPGGIGNGSIVVVCCRGGVMPHGWKRHHIVEGARVWLGDDNFAVASMRGRLLEGLVGR